MTEPRRIKCRFCRWTTLSFVTRADGKTVSGMVRIKSHIEDAHPIEYEKIYGLEGDR